MWKALLVTVVIFFPALVHAEGLFHFYNAFENENTRFRVSVKGAATGKTVSSPGFLESRKLPWSQRLVGGQYRLIIEGHGWTRDLGWINVDSKIAEGNICVGRSDQYWSLQEYQQKDGKIVRKWTMAAAAPASQVVTRRPSVHTTVDVFERRVEKWFDEDAVVNVPMPIDGGAQQAVFKPKKYILGASVRKCAEGIHVDSVKSGSAASRTRDNNGQPITLEPGDHILEWNGQAAETLEQFLDWVSVSAEADIVLKDGRTGRIVRLKVGLDQE